MIVCIVRTVYCFDVVYLELCTLITLRSVDAGRLAYATSKPASADLVTIVSNYLHGMETFDSTLNSHTCVRIRQGA
jgi:hypothetical protein